MKETVSVIMPLYNAWPYVKEAVESVQKQSVADWELWVVNDASSDEGTAYIKKMMQTDSRIHLLCNKENLGVSASRNLALEASKGEYIAFLDSDDIWHSNKLEKQLKRIKESNADMVCSSYAIVNEQGVNCCKDFIVPKTVDFARMKKQNVVGCSTMMLKRDCLKQHHFRDEYYHEDYALWLELISDRCTIVTVQEVLVDYRIRQGSRSWSKYHAVKEHWRILKDLLHLPLWEQLYCMLCYGLTAIQKYRPERRKKHESQVDATAEPTI